jgi:hypothetical protein
MIMVDIFGKMVTFMKEFGKMEDLMVLDNLNIVMEIN